MAKVECGHLKTQFESGHSDGQVPKTEGDAFCGLLALNAANATGDLQRHGMDRNIAAQLIDERQPPQTIGFGLGAISPMYQLSDGDDRETRHRFRRRRPVSVPGCAVRCGHAVRLRRRCWSRGSIPRRRIPGLRLRMVSSTSAAKSGSSTGDFPVSSSCLFASAVHSEMVRRGRTGRWITATGSLLPALSMTTSAPARTLASTKAKSRAASASEMWITLSATTRLYRRPFSCLPSALPAPSRPGCLVANGAD